jgi:hypothetical protein
MIVIVNNKSVLVRLSLCTVTLTRSSGRPDRNTSMKYLRRSRRAHIKYINIVKKWVRFKAESGLAFKKY